MATKNKELAVWAEVVAVPLATTKKGKIVLLLTGVMRLGRDLPQARIVVVVVEDSGAAIEEEIGWNEVNF
jgi:D-serine deaminase-like pyridoxal phosphate-dependent protein